MNGGCGGGRKNDRRTRPFVQQWTRGRGESAAPEPSFSFFLLRSSGAPLRSPVGFGTGLLRSTSALFCCYGSLVFSCSALVGPCEQRSRIRIGGMFWYICFIVSSGIEPGLCSVPALLK